jgi:Arm DNA-binding domain
LVTPKGRCRWRYNYRFARKYRSLSLGTYPIVSLEDARSRHKFARRLLVRRFDPAALKAVVGKHVFTVTTREWKVVVMEALPIHWRTTFGEMGL